jgi:hypothetical protein
MTYADLQFLCDTDRKFQDDVQRTGVYQRPIIQQVVNSVLFSGDHPLAIECSEYFGDAVSEGALALILTAVCLFSTTWIVLTRCVDPILYQAPRRPYCWELYRGMVFRVRSTSCAHLCD